MAYQPKVGVDARTKDGRRATDVQDSQYADTPFRADVPGHGVCLFHADGRRMESAMAPETNLVADWEEAAAPMPAYQPKVGVDARTKDGRRATDVGIWDGDRRLFAARIGSIPGIALFHDDGKRVPNANQPETDLVADWEEPAAQPLDLGGVRRGDTIIIERVVLDVEPDGALRIIPHEMLRNPKWIRGVEFAAIAKGDRVRIVNGVEANTPGVVLTDPIEDTVLVKWGSGNPPAIATLAHLKRY